MTFVEQAFEVPQIRSASIRRDHNGRVSGVASDEFTEYDVVREGFGRWYASDDEGVRHYGVTLKAALKRAVSANTFV